MTFRVEDGSRAPFLMSLRTCSALSLGSSKMADLLDQTSVKKTIAEDLSLIRSSVGLSSLETSGSA